MNTKISSLDTGYTTGALSLFPLAVDDKESLYEAKNNAKAVLTQSLAYTARYIVVDDASGFPETGLLRIGPENGKEPGELVYYGKRTSSTFSDLIRGFAGSRTNYWPAKKTFATNAVMAEHHNSIKDAIVNMEVNLGLKYTPDENSLNGILKAQEKKFLTPKGQFIASSRRIKPGQPIAFHNFSSGHIVRFLWDFGDGSTSIEKNPNHVYLNEGNYTIKLNTITSDGRQGVSNKYNYINVSADNGESFFYVVPTTTEPNYSVNTATTQSATAQNFEFVDQSDGDIAQRIWVFGDNESETVTDPDIHSTHHVYQAAGSYEPTLLIVMQNQSVKRINISEKVVVI